MDPMGSSNTSRTARNSFEENRLPLLGKNTLTSKDPTFSRVFIRDPYIGLYYNLYIIGQYNPLHTLNNKFFVH